MTYKWFCFVCRGKLREGRHGRPMCEDCLFTDEGESK